MHCITRVFCSSHVCASTKIICPHCDAQGVAPDIPEYYAFLISSGTSALACVIGMFVFPDCDPEDLKKFYVNTRWVSPFSQLVPERGVIGECSV